MILYIILLIVGFIILIKGADIFVDGASATAGNFKVSKMVIGLTIVAFGTSAPELAVSLKAMSSGSGDLVFGNVIGSNIINILLILGVTSLITPLKVKRSTIKKELPILLLVTSILGVLSLDRILGNGVNALTRADGIVIILVFFIFIYYLFTTMRNKVDEDNELPEIKLPKALLMTVSGIVAIVVGSSLVVTNASELAELLGVSHRMIALTVVALGTSLPELVTSVTAARKKEVDIAIGNIVGSNLFNIGLVLGIPTTIFGSITLTSFSVLDIVILIVSALVLFVCAFSKKKVSKKEGIMMIILFVVYYATIIFM